LAAGISAVGTMRGMIACRAGELTAKPADCTAVSASSSIGLRTPSSACASRPTVDSQVSAELASRSLRRSTTSAAAPPHNPKTSRGTNPATPSRPTQPEDCVMANISTGTATAVNWNPKNETPLPIHIRR
jgi:hypothetical protein